MPVTQRSVGVGGRRGNFRWTPPLAQEFDFRKLEEPLLQEVFARMEELRKQIQEYARANAPWGHKRNDTMGRETPRARPGLFAFKQRQKGGIVIGLSHGPRTVNRGFPYGIALETFLYDLKSPDDLKKLKTVRGQDNDNRIGETEGEGTYAIINPTMQHFYPTVMRRLDGAFNAAVKGKTPKKSSGSRVFRG